MGETSIFNESYHRPSPQRLTTGRRLIGATNQRAASADPAANTATVKAGPAVKRVDRVVSEVAAANTVARSVERLGTADGAGEFKESDAALIAILDAPLYSGEPALVGFARKERELACAFAALPVVE